MSKLIRTVAWITVGAVNGSLLGALLGMCFGWFTVGCNMQGYEAAWEGARFGLIPGGMTGALAGAVCEARRIPPGRLLTPTLLIGGVGVIGGYIGLPVAGHMTFYGSRSLSDARLGQIGLALHAYFDQHEFAPPPATLPGDDLPPEDRLSWCVALLPYLEQRQLAESIDRAAGWNAEVNQRNVRTRVPVFLGPLAPPRAGEAARTAYVGVTGVGEDS